MPSAYYALVGTVAQAPVRQSSRFRPLLPKRTAREMCRLGDDDFHGDGDGDADGAALGEADGAADGAGEGDGSGGQAPPSCFFRVMINVTPLSSISLDS